MNKAEWVNHFDAIREDNRARLAELHAREDKALAGFRAECRESTPLALAILARRCERTLPLGLADWELETAVRPYDIYGAMYWYKQSGVTQHFRACQLALLELS
jgi:hypothetical protein